MSSKKLLGSTSRTTSYLDLLQKYQYFFKSINKNDLVQQLIWQSPKLKFSDSDIQNFEDYVRNLTIEENDLQQKLQD